MAHGARVNRESGIDNPLRSSMMTEVPNRDPNSAVTSPAKGPGSLQGFVKDRLRAMQRIWSAATKFIMN